MWYLPLMATGGTGKGPAAAGGQYNSQVSTSGRATCISSALVWMILNVYHLRKNEDFWGFFQVAKKKINHHPRNPLSCSYFRYFMSFPGFPTTSSHCRWENQPWINRIKVDHWGCSFLHLGDVTGGVSLGTGITKVDFCKRYLKFADYMASGIYAHRWVWSPRCFLYNTSDCRNQAREPVWQKP